MDWLVWRSLPSPLYPPLWRSARPVLATAIRLVWRTALGIMNIVSGTPRVYNRLHAIPTRSPYHLHTNKFHFTLLGLSKSDLEVVRSMPQ